MDSAGDLGDGEALPGGPLPRLLRLTLITVLPGGFTGSDGPTVGVVRTGAMLDCV